MSLHEWTHIHLVMVPDGNFYKTLRYHTALQNFLEKKGSNQNAPPKEAQKSPHRPPSHRTSTKPSSGRGAPGARSKTRRASAEKKETMSTAKSPRCLAEVKDDNGKSSTFLKPRMEKISDYLTMPMQLPSRTFPWSSLATAGRGTVVKAGLSLMNDRKYIIPHKKSIDDKRMKSSPKAPPQKKIGAVPRRTCAISFAFACSVPDSSIPGPVRCLRCTWFLAPQTCLEYCIDI